MNPADGPGSSRSTAYTSGIAKLQGAGIKVIGYVATGYTANSIASVEAKIDQWKSFYPTLQGIFFDEQSNQAADVPYYRTVSQYAKSQGLTFTVGNPGQDTAEAYVGALDVMLIYETDGVPIAAQMGGWHTKYPRVELRHHPLCDARCQRVLRGSARKVRWRTSTCRTTPAQPVGQPAALLRRSAGRPRVMAWRAQSDGCALTRNHAGQARVEPRHQQPGTGIVPGPER